MKLLRTMLLAPILVLELLAATPSLETQDNADGLRSVETHWSQAFVHGDVGYLQSLLSDDYVSINAKGVVRDRATVIGMAQKYAAGNPAPLPTTAPPKISVVGTTGISTSDAGGQRSVDVFFYADGRWHALYSQHTSITP